MLQGFMLGLETKLHIFKNLLLYNWMYGSFCNQELLKNTETEKQNTL